MWEGWALLLTYELPMNRDRYIQVLREHMINSFAIRGVHCHISKQVKDTLNGKNIPVMT